jgi:hypothetical protein
LLLGISMPLTARGFLGIKLWIFGNSNVGSIQSTMEQRFPEGIFLVLVLGFEKSFNLNSERLKVNLKSGWRSIYKLPVPHYRTLNKGRRGSTANSWRSVCDSKTRRSSLKTSL